MRLFRRRRDKGVRLSRREWAREQLRKIAVLPTLMTLLNGIAGLAAIHAVMEFAAAPTTYRFWGMTDGFLVAAFFLFLANIADSLDGRIARFTRQTTDFGGQLDSLCDVVSFGVAPAVMVHSIVVYEVAAAGDRLDPTVGQMLIRVAWVICAAYFACAALRLARFNVENVHDESSHLWFKGLPSPGAAIGMMMIPVVRSALAVDLPADHWSRLTLLWATPLLALTLGLLMVSRFRYPHVVNQYINRRRSFAYVARLLAAGVLVTTVTIAVGPAYSATIAVYLYIFSGAAVGIYRQARGLPLNPPLLGESVPTGSSTAASGDASAVAAVGSSAAVRAGDDGGSGAGPELGPHS